MMKINLLEKNVAPNFELAAIVVREHIPFDCVDKVGGWGLKFLNTLRCECYDRENDEDYSSGNRISDSSNSSFTLSMRNINDGLYHGYFAPPLSALQSFSIALAITHWWNHSIRPVTAKKLG
ncbi:hypothetical protein KIW84_022843 [Lathyrus oleraceus]|uniref:Uncharacterized protein n=1 Tax=Pisum sativum TaxID=3888 RepID=A0A9D4YBF6_PEA|nr:hypothetical protein KIW84_022843 [Pisum sativum]